MKRWQKVLITIVSVLLALVVAGFIAFKVWLEPIIDEKIEEVAVKMSEILNDDAFQSQIDEMAQSMMDDGVIKPEDVPTYNKLKQENEAKRREEEEAAQRALEQIVAEDGNSGTDAPEQTQIPEKTQQPITTQIPQTNPQNNTAEIETTPQTVVKEDKKPTPTPLTKDTLRDRLKKAMTPDEFAFALSLYNRIDLGYAQSLLNTDRSAAKEYIYSKASPGEIARALEIYAKYAYLLK